MPFCPHCRCIVSDRTYRDHRLNYWNKETREWTLPRDCDEFEVCQGSLGVTPLETRRPIDEKDESLQIEQLEESFTGECSISSEFLVDPIPTAQLISDLPDELHLPIDAKESSIQQFEDTDPDEAENKRPIDSLSRWFILFIISWMQAFKISENAIACLLNFLGAFLTVLSKSVPLLSWSSEIIPGTIYQLYTKLGLQKDTFTRYVVCPDCSTLFEYSQCVPQRGRNCLTRICTAIKYPNHPHNTKRRACGSTLASVVTYNHGERRFHPHKVYCYKSIIESLEQFFARPGFYQMCQKWKKRTYIPGYYRDIYDGKIWRDFQEIDGLPFLSGECNLGFMLNIDWFQPFKFSPYSVGAVYLSVINLPRKERFKLENVMLVAILPGPHEPDADGLCKYIKPLVNELLQLWEHGVEVKEQKGGNSKAIKVKGALLCIAADLPAARKLCGFLGHSAKLGCSKCTKEFKTGNFGEKTDYGGFNRERPRCPDEHRIKVAACLKATCASTRAEYQRQNGVRYSELVRLPYMDLVRMTVIDPMHNLFMGTAKFLFKDVWQSKHQLHKKEKLKNIQDIIDTIEVPSEMGRIPQKIASSFSSFTADQWKNWTLYYSMFAMKGHLPQKSFDVWVKFVEACHLLCRPIITLTELSKANENILEFCKNFESVYGSILVTPNMHFHTHLIECIIDYGPVYAFWLFSFERFNGCLGSFPTNKKNIELQIMRQFQRTQYVKNQTKPVTFNEEFSSCFENLSHTQVGSLALSNYDLDEQTFLSAKTMAIGELVKGPVWLTTEDTIGVQGKGREGLLLGTHLTYLKASLKTFLGNINTDQVSGAFKMYQAIQYLGDTYGSAESRLSNSGNIMASWNGYDGQIDPNSELQPGQIVYFLQFFVKMKSSDKPSLIDMVYVKWLQRHSDKYFFHQDLATVWAAHELFDPEGPSSFMPVKRINGKYLPGHIKVKGESVTVAIKRNSRIIW